MSLIAAQMSHAMSRAVSKCRPGHGIDVHATFFSANENHQKSQQGKPETMFTKRAVALGLPVFMGIYASKSDSAIMNEPKRNFYLNEEDVVPVPGTTSAATGTQLEVLGPNKMVNGVSVRSTEPTEGLFRGAREALQNSIKSGQELVNDVYTRYYNTERQVTSTVSELHYKKEPLFPNALYVIVGALSGNIFARQRGVLSKLLFPIVFGGISFKYFLPQTFDNTTLFLWKLEEKNLPHIAENQKLAADKAAAWAKTIEQDATVSKKYLEERGTAWKKSIADVTGLNVDETVSKK